VAVLECGCEQEITGVLVDSNFTVTEFDMIGEGSGTFWEWILEPALKESTGILEATLVWEGGDTIVASNGDVWTEIQFNTEDLYREFPLPSTRH